MVSHALTIPTAAITQPSKKYLRHITFLRYRGKKIVIRIIRNRSNDHFGKKDSSTLTQPYLISGNAQKPKIVRGLNDI